MSGPISPTVPAPLPVAPDAAAPAPGGSDYSADRASQKSRIREAAEAFEGMLLQMMMRAMREAQLEEGFFGKGAGSSTYEGMFDQALSDSMAGRTPLGIADLLEARWSGELETAKTGAFADTPDWIDRLERARDAYREGSR